MLPYAVGAVCVRCGRPMLPGRRSTSTTPTTARRIWVGRINRVIGSQVAGWVMSGAVYGEKGPE